MSEGIKVRIFGDDSDLQKTLADSAKRVAKYGAAALAAGAAIAIAMTKRGLEAVDAQAKLARQLNTTTESMATLSRAGQLSGVAMDKITTSAKQLDVALGRASQGGNAQAQVFDRLGLSAEQLAGVPLDQRITKINEAIRKNIPAVEQASVAAELFGTRNAAAMMSLDSAAMERAAREAKVFGLAISDIDAAKVENANDSFSRFGMMLEGITKQMAIQVAPILDLIGEMFFNAAEEAGGLGNKVETVFDDMIKGGIRTAAGFKRAFSGVKSALDDAWAGFQSLPPWAQEVGIAGAMIGGKKGVLALTLFGKAAEDTKVTIAWFKAMAEGDISFAEFIKPQDVANYRTRLAELGREVEDFTTSDKSIISALFGTPADVDEWEAEMLAKFEGAKDRAQEIARKAVESRGLGLNIPIINENDLAEGIEAYQAYIDELVAANGTWLHTLVSQLATERELMDQAFWDDLEQLAEAHDQKLIAEEEYQKLRKQIIERYNNDIAAMEQREADNKLALAQSIFGDLSTLMNTQSRKLFEVGKAAAIANSIVDTYAGMSKALAQGGFRGIAMAAAVGARGFANVSAIRSQSFGGGGAGAVATGSNTAAINAASQPVAPAQGSPMTTVIRLQGDIFGASQVRQLIEQLNEGQRDGGRIILG
jgi:hypothetical protein